MTTKEQAFTEDKLGASTIRILSVPSAHVYVQHLSTGDGSDCVVRLPDPVVSPDVPAAQWWPPPALKASWVREHADEFDVFHLHFGFDTATPAELTELVTTLRDRQKPLVYTVHDLRNPHHPERELHDAQLDVLVPAADALITLTQGAADEITQRWGRVPLVLAHPHVVPTALLRRPRRNRPEFIVGLHLKSLRANMDPLPVLDVLCEVARTLPAMRLRVDVHTDVMTQINGNFDADVATKLSGLAHCGAIELSVHDFFTDAQLWDYLQDLDLSVLPYRFGTHSGWLEACHDLGTTVLVSDCGYYTDQRPCLTYASGPTGVDHDSVRAGVLRAYQMDGQWRADAAERDVERQHIAARHRALYQELLRE